MTDQPTQPTSDQPSRQPTDPATHPQPNSATPGGRRILPPAGSTGSGPTAGGSTTVDKPTFAPRKIPSGGLAWNKVAVPLVAALVAILAVFWLASGPEDTSFADARDEIESMDDLNNESTAGAPQQEVVNGWTTIEYLNLLSTQQEHENNRRDALLLLMLVSGLAAYTHHHLKSRYAHQTSDPPAGE